jgi:hypothetical protein
VADAGAASAARAVVNMLLTLEKDLGDRGFRAVDVLRPAVTARIYPG